MEPVYVIAPTAVVSALVCSVVYTRHMRKRVAPGGVEYVLTEKWRAAFRLAPNEWLHTFWKGQIYDGPVIPEYHNEADDTAGRLTEHAAAVAGVKLRPRKAQIYLAMTTQNRIVVGCSKQRGPDDHEVTPHSEWGPGSPVFFARDLKVPPGNPPLMENGYRGRPYFVMFGTGPGVRLPMWVPADAAAAIATWRVARKA
jgi:hypothetical protein